VRLAPLLVLLLLSGCTGCTGPAPGAGPRFRAPAATELAQEWRKVPPSRWQLQRSGNLNLAVQADVFELDVYTTPASVLRRLHAAGRRGICRVNAGAHEDGRPDAARIPPALRGAPTGRQHERWLDIRRWDVLQPVLADRFKLCQIKGFDAIAVDNVDGYTHPSGFPLTAADQLRFNRQLAGLAHERDLAIGLRNDIDQVRELEPDFDFAINEECFRHGECNRLRPFVIAGKMVFHVEYEVPPSAFCGTTRALGFASMRKRPALDAWRQTC
jgi:hypothetical protein